MTAKPYKWWLGRLVAGKFLSAGGEAKAAPHLRWQGRKIAWFLLLLWENTNTYANLFSGKTEIVDLFD